MDLSNSKVLITGASSGIGKELAKQLSLRGSKLLLTGRNQQRLEKVARDTGSEFMVADVSSEADVKNTFEKLEKSLAGLDVLINNAGIGYRSALIDIDPQKMREVWETNVLGPTLMAQHAAAKYFIPNKKGAIVNIASTAALKGYATGSSYASSKFALRALSECWRSELRPYNVRVMNICPSEVTTAFGSDAGVSREEEDNKLRALDVSQVIISALELDDRGFIPELSIFATNPF